MTNPADHWWAPHRQGGPPPRHAERRTLLLARNRIQRALREMLDAQDFIEVDPAGLQVTPSNEAHLHGFATTAIGNDGAPRQMYLHTSPEFAMKKLLAAGEVAIYAFAHVWRNRERGRLHSPEFTMLEWYRAGADYTQLMDDTCAMIARAAQITGAAQLYYNDVACDPYAAPERLSVADAFQRYAGIDLLQSIQPDGSTDAAALARALDQAGISHCADDTWSDMLSRVLVARVEPHLGHGRITILDQYPAAEAALARRLPGDARLSERFEVYTCGVELANGFGELTDADEQRRRFTAEMDEKERIYAERYPIDESLLAALPLMPPTAGIALGFDRLVMLATGAPRIDDVIWTPVE
ncbi:Lysine--tRNA ligase [Ketogulonicigenium vulgare Y25]|uniref:EF-P lysine aminoacylase EpmA n=1 Tax=Ketogulonicigenium vulgare TaxID=92945 RepID=UPI0001E67D2A|nr:Lysine--tRNA ligase [Ketogulonicigenium vulgare Y25]